MNPTVGQLIEAESIDGAWEELRIVGVNLDAGAILAETTAKSFGRLRQPARFDIADLNSTWRYKAPTGRILGRDSE